MSTTAPGRCCWPASGWTSSEPVNIGTGVETRIRDLAETIRRLVRFPGELVWDASQPDGQPTRRLDVSRARELMGFEATMRLEEGLRSTIAYFESEVVAAR